MSFEHLRASLTVVCGVAAVFIAADDLLLCIMACVFEVFAFSTTVDAFVVAFVAASAALVITVVVVVVFAALGNVFVVNDDLCANNDDSFGVFTALVDFSFASAISFNGLDVLCTLASGSFVVTLFVVGLDSFGTFKSLCAFEAILG